MGTQETTKEDLEYLLRSSCLNKKKSSIVARLLMPVPISSNSLAKLSLSHYMFIPLGVWGTERLGVPGRLPLTDSLLISLTLLMELAPRCRCAGMPLTAVLTPMLGVPGCTPPTTLQSRAKQG
jgi:hypothetical protein